MSLRIRDNGDIVCGAKTEEEPGDTYINDGLAYLFSLNGYVEPDPDEAETGRWHWRVHEPYWRVLDGT